jgi:holo-[acyl-carrier protein] synthase
MLRVGVDMIEVARIEAAIQRHGDRFFKRFYTQAERDYCHDMAISLAARLAGKEAVSKALGTGIGDVRWVEIEILGDERRRPTLTLYGDALRVAQELGLEHWDISLSHTESHALAFVVALG